MHKSLLIALALTAGSVASASSSATFTGGSGDGSAHGDFITPRQASAAFHFLGGSGDGYSSGIRRGYQPAAIPGLVRFAGSVGDGYSSSSWRGYQPAAVPALARFAGAVRDGYASSKMLSSGSQTKPGRFTGGGFDGYDRSAIYGIPNWAIGDTDANVGDTDANGLPDWWELKYFAILTGTPINGDADHDGMSNLNEYLTGTNPTNAISYFHITRLKPGSPNKIFVYSEPGYYYTLQQADDLALGWTSVSNQIRISTAAEGELEMNDTISGAGGFYRVLSEH
jgi:hypothetical protein